MVESATGPGRIIAMSASAPINAPVTSGPDNRRQRVHRLRDGKRMPRAVLNAPPQ